MMPGVAELAAAEFSESQSEAVRMALAQAESIVMMLSHALQSMATHALNGECMGREVWAAGATANDLQGYLAALIDAVSGTTQQSLQAAGVAVH